MVCAGVGVGFDHDGQSEGEINYVRSLVGIALALWVAARVSVLWEEVLPE